MGYHIEGVFETRPVISVSRFFDGKLAVDAFFVISGFLITYILLSEQEKFGRISLKGFYIRRIFRLVPVYCLAILTYLTVGLLVPGQEEILNRTIKGLPYYFSLRNEFMPTDGSVALGHTWSLSVEEKFYLFWPVIFLKISFFLRRQWLPFISMFLMIPIFSDFPIFFAYLSIGVGCFVAWCLHRKILIGSDVITSRLGRPDIGWILLILNLTFYYLVIPCDQFTRFGFSLLFSILMIHLILGESTITRFLSKPLCVSMGKRAYGMYLFHMVFVNPVQNILINPNSNQNYILCLIVSYVGLAIFTHFLFKYFEQPLTLKGREVSKMFAPSHRPGDGK